MTNVAIDRYRTLVFVLIVLSIISTGCYRTPGVPYNRVEFDGSVTFEDSTFELDGQIELDSGTGPTPTYSDVRVTLYDSDKEAIQSTPVGTLSMNESQGPGRRRVNVTSQRVPKYVLIESSDFWTTEAGVSVEAFVRVDGRYDAYYRTHPGQKFKTAT